jgi:hypothetical protein
MKGMHGEPVTVGEQMVTPQAVVGVRGKVVIPCEHVREVHWWKYVGVALQGDMKHDKMVDQMVGAGKAKAVAMGNYHSFAGGLTPAVQLAVVTAIMPGVMLYAAPVVWGGVCVGTGATERDMDRLSNVWDGVLRSVFGCAKYGMKALYRSEARWPSFRLAVARSVTQYYARVVLLKQDMVSGGGKVTSSLTRPVQALMSELLARQRGRRDEGVMEGTGMGKKMTASLELVLQARSADHALARGGAVTKSAWKEAISHGMKRAMRLELEYLVQSKSSLSGDTYAAFRKGTGMAYYLHRAKEIGFYNYRSNTLYRLVHLRVASHALAQRTCHFEGGGSAKCPCGNEECEGEETAAYFLFGCPTKECLREAFYEEDERIREAVRAAKFRKFEVWRLNT